MSKQQAIVSGLLGLGFVGFVGATALPFNDQIEFQLGKYIDSRPAWLVPPRAEFKSLQRGYGGVKILLSLLATGSMVTVMIVARKEGEHGRRQAEPRKQECPAPCGWVVAPLPCHDNCQPQSAECR